MKFDIVIIGGGLVGASLLAALRDSGLKLAMIESRPPTSIPVDESWDARVYAISPGSAQFLQSLNVWQELIAERVTPVYEMQVHGDDLSARLNFSAYENGVPELAYIAENRQLQHAIWGMLTNNQSHTKIFCPAQCKAIAWHESHAELTLSDGTSLHAALVVGADGVNSWVREQAGINAEWHSYYQTGIVANFQTERTHHNVAFQWFRRDGILALLPLPDKRVSMVWSANKSTADRLLNSTDEALGDCVAEAANYSLGKMQLITRPLGFPLNRVHVSTLVKPRMVLIGDAAHGIHPLAGQGVNLGLRDARELANLLLQFDGIGDCGDYQILRYYERSRKEDILAMEWVTDGLQKLFGSEHPTLIRLRNLGFEITNRLPILKNRLMQHALS